MCRQHHFSAVSCFLQTSFQWSALAAVWVSLLAAPFVRGDSGLNRSRFLEEYRPHAAQLEQRYSNIIFAFTTTSDAGDKNQISETTGKLNRRNFLLRSKSCKLVEKNTGKIVREYQFKEEEAIDGRNALYSFAISPGKGGERVLRELTIYDANQETAFCFLTAPFANWEWKKTYLEIAEDPKTQIIVFADRLWQGKPSKVLECKYSRVHPVTQKPVNVKEKFYFAPNDGWICCGLTSGSDPESTEYLEQIYSYEPEPQERLPKLKRWEKWLRNSENPSKSRLLDATDITEFRRASAPFSDADFTLTAFGLPEPVGIEQPEPPRTWIWLIAGAIGAGLTAIVFAWLKRRHATTLAAKT